MKRKIITFGAKGLRAKARKIERVTEEIRTLADELIATMRAARGLGLAAEQVDLDLALCVIEIPEDLLRESHGGSAPVPAMPMVLINPRIVASEGKQRSEEGCLSFPEIFPQITRAQTVTVEFLDREGRECRETIGGLTARAAQHEIDHLNGVLLVDRMSPAQRVVFAGPLKKLRSRTLSPAIPPSQPPA